MNTSQLIEIVVLAAVAVFVLARLYTVLGRRTGAERPDPPATPQRTEEGAARFETAPRTLPQSEAPAAAPGGLAAVQRLDPNFDPGHFMSGARAAYEMIVQAFAKGDRDTLRVLLSPRVFDAYAKALSEREATGEAGSELVRLKSAEIVDAGVAGSALKVAVRFEAELAEGAHGLRDTRERWTFERDARSDDPNWRLAGVALA